MNHPVCWYAMAYFFEPSLLFDRRLSWAKTCFVNTPEQRTFTPSLISWQKRFSPSWLIAVRFRTSITSSRPLRPARARSRADSTSLTHGETSLPSMTSLRCLGLSMIEILNTTLTHGW